jgi:hypothetical protein
MQPTPRRLACAEIWTGNHETTSLVELPGLTAWSIQRQSGRITSAAMFTTCRSVRAASFPGSRWPM